MEVRSYYASTLGAAIALARQELGPEALLVQSQRTAPEWMHLGRYEAVFAAEIVPPAQKAAPAPALPRPTPANSKATPVDLISRPDLRALLQASGRLTANGSRRPPTPAAEPLISCDPGIGRKGFAITTALIGPSGVGKTTTAMKLALRHGVLQSRSVRLIAFDPYRVGGTRQIRHFADLFSLSFTDCELISQFQTALAAETADVTLIDTPGFSMQQTGEREQLAACLRLFPEIETQLVLRLDRKPADNLRAVDSFSSFAPSRAILTCLDETAEFADVQPLITRANIPVSFLGTGQRLLEDFEPAAPQRLIEVLRNGWAKSASAAA